MAETKVSKVLTGGGKNAISENERKISQLTELANNFIEKNKKNIVHEETICSPDDAVIWFDKLLISWSDNDGVNCIDDMDDQAANDLIKLARRISLYYSAREADSDERCEDLWRKMNCLIKLQTKLSTPFDKQVSCRTAMYLAGTMRYQMGDVDKNLIARAMLADLVGKVKDAYGADHYRYYQVVRSLGLAENRIGNHKRALKNFNKAIEAGLVISSKALRDHNDEIVVKIVKYDAMINWEMALIDQKNGNYKTALSKLKTAIASGRFRSHNAANINWSAATTAAHLGNFEQAAFYHGEARSILELIDRAALKEGQNSDIISLTLWIAADNLKLNRYDTVIEEIIKVNELLASRPEPNYAYLKELVLYQLFKQATTLMDDDDLQIIRIFQSKILGSSVSLPKQTTKILANTIKLRKAINGKPIYNVAKCITLTGL